MVSDIDTAIRNTGWLPFFSLARWLRIKSRRKSGLITEYIDENQSKSVQNVKPTTRIVEEYIVDEHGIPIHHRTINSRLLDSSMITKKFSTHQNPTVPALNNMTESTTTEAMRESMRREGKSAVQSSEHVTSGIPPTTTESIDRSTVPVTLTKTSTMDTSSTRSSGTTVKEGVHASDQTSGSMRPAALSTPRPTISNGETTTYPTRFPLDKTISSKRETLIPMTSIT